MTRRIIQFGTSRFLQAHVDLFVHQARLAGEEIGPITVVKTTPGQDRAGRVAALKRGVPFPVRIRGIEGGRIVDELFQVASVDQAFDAQHEWAGVVRCFAQDAKIVVSNVGDRGYERFGDDALYDFASTAPPRGFSAKLLVLLLARFRQSGEPLLFLPTEPFSGNGRRLAGLVSALAADTGQSAAFRAWLTESAIFADTLVDRIVSESIEPIGAVAEPYALWAIHNVGFDQPFHHPAMRLVENLEMYERLKLHILNLGHTVLADRWMKQRRAADHTVRAILSDREVIALLMDIYEEEILPGFAAQGLASEARRYMNATLERFQNPFLEHRLADIAQNHEAKLKNRVSAFLDWMRQRDPGFAAPRLSALLGA